MTESSWHKSAVPGGAVPPREIDTSVAHPARIYDYWLGGTNNFAADREAGDLVLASRPGLRESVQANRAFLGRVVRLLAGELGIRQFLDLGTGIPSADNTPFPGRPSGAGIRFSRFRGAHGSHHGFHLSQRTVVFLDREHFANVWFVNLTAGNKSSGSAGH